MFGAAAVPGSRQGCFKCGNLGHIAENCQAPDRLCYNCREPGHESTNCPQPRSTDGKQCYACGGVGHVKADCPSMRGAFGGGFAPGGGAGFAGGQKCYTCGRVGTSTRSICRSSADHASSSLPLRLLATAPPQGHIARMCPAAGGFRGGFGSRGGFNARPRAVVNANGTPVKCYRCNGENHLARDCLAPRDESAALAAKKCYKCQETGHIARDCPKEAEELPTAE